MWKSPASIWCESLRSERRWLIEGKGAGPTEEDVEDAFPLSEEELVDIGVLLDELFVVLGFASSVSLGGED